MLYSCNFSRGRCQFISNRDLGSAIHEEELVYTFKGCRERLPRGKITHKYIHLISEARSRLVCIAHEHAWPLTSPHQKVDNPCSYIPCRPCYEVFHLGSFRHLTVAHMLKEAYDCITPMSTRLYNSLHLLIV